MSTNQIVAAVVGAVLVFWAVGAYNRLMRLRNTMRQSFQQLDAQLRQRHELIPVLAAATTAGAVPAAGEQAAVAEAAGAARQQAHAALDLARAHPGTAGPMVSLAMAEQVLEDVCRRLQDAIDADPALKADTAVQAARDDLLGAEGRLGFARQMFNEAVAEHNDAVQQFPTRVLCSLFGFQDASPLPAPTSSRRPSAS